MEIESNTEDLVAYYGVICWGILQSNASVSNSIFVFFFSFPIPTQHALRLVTRILLHLFFSFFFISFNHYLLPKSVYHCMSLIWEGSSFSIFLVDENGFVIRFMMELDLFLTLDDDDGGTDAARSAPLSLGSFNFFINE